MNDFDKEVLAAYQNVTEVENKARHIEERIKKIDGAAALLPPRGYGKPVDTAAINSNMTLQSSPP